MNPYENYSVSDGSLQDLVRDWKKPRPALPSLSYLSPLLVGFSYFYTTIVLFILSVNMYEVTHAYMLGQGFDVQASQFAGLTFIFFVASYGAAGQLRRIAMSHSLRRQARNLIVTAEYRTDLSPVEAGVIIDAASGDNEIAATIQQLQSKDCLRIVQTDQGLLLKPAASLDNAGEDEAVFARSLFLDSGEVYLHDTGHLRRAGGDMRRAAYKRMVQLGYIPLLGSWGKVNYFFITALSYCGFGVSLIFFFSLFSSEAYVIKYPRFPMYAWEVWVTATQFVVLLIVPLQAYFTKVLSRDGLEKYREAAGLFMYMKTVYRDRIKDGALSRSEAEYYLPYAQAFGFEDVRIEPDQGHANP